jgi:hypothetical protein
LILDLAKRRRGLENVFLACRLEVRRDRFLERVLVLRDHARHLIELLDAPRIGAGNARREKRLLGVK